MTQTSTNTNEFRQGDRIIATVASLGEHGSPTFKVGEKVRGIIIRRSHTATLGYVFSTHFTRHRISCLEHGCAHLGGGEWILKLEQFDDEGEWE